MKRRSIFIGFSDRNVALWKLLERRVGDGFAAPVNQDREPIPRFVFGVIVAEHNDADGKMLILRNSKKGENNFVCAGWDYIPIWFGGGQYGVVAWWKDPIAKERCHDARLADEWSQDLADMAEEHRVSCAMAL